MCRQDLARLLHDAGQPVNALVVAVDGPGGSGKSTVSRLLAERIGWAHLD
ncbi:MAG: (d)CMP kinase, partial [Acidimicrobiia bacterium]|nr:(d)CMP kinase [Acidimicrobiia bacterium]